MFQLNHMGHNISILYIYLQKFCGFFAYFNIYTSNNNVILKVFNLSRDTIFCTLSRAKDGIWNFFSLFNTEFYYNFFHLHTMIKVEFLTYLQNLCKVKKSWRVRMHKGVKCPLFTVQNRTTFEYFNSFLTQSQKKYQSLNCQFE